MSDVRVIAPGGRRSRVPGETVGVGVNTFGMKRLMVGIDGQFLAEVTKEALEIAYLDAYEAWAFLTGASRDSLEVAITEVGATSARGVLQAGGEKLINDPRNKKHIDYAPFLEFNGSPSGSMSPGTIVGAVIHNDKAMRDYIHMRVAERIQELTRE